jgi:hypothetical protein
MRLDDGVQLNSIGSSMIKKIPFILTFILGLLATEAFAADLLPSDSGTYAILNKEHVPTGMYYRLLFRDGKWTMYGKKPGARWQNITCDNGCEYQKATDDDVQSYFPATFRDKVDIACIKNTAQAFCRYTPKVNPDNKIAHMVIALVTGNPIPMFLRQVPPETVP